MGELIRIYKVERDDNSGRIRSSLAFDRAEFRRIREPNTGLVMEDEMDGGCVGAIVAPAGSRLVETGSGTVALEVPGSTVGVSAGEAWDLAKQQQMGFRFP